MKSPIACFLLMIVGPVAHAQLAVHVDEDFDAGIPITWTVLDVSCPATNWHGTTGGYNGNYLDGTEFAFIDSDAAGQFCLAEDYLVSPAFDASGSAELLLEFDHYFRFWTTGSATVQVFDGSSWTDVVTYGATIGAWGAPDHAVLDLTTWANANMQVRFKYTGNWDWWWAIDNVLVHEPVPPPGVYCSAKTNSQGCTPGIGFSGSPTLSGPDDFLITASNVLNNKPGILIWSHSPDSLPFMGGFLCLGGSPIVRTPLQDSGGNPPPSDCSGTYSFHFSQGYMASKSVAPLTQLYAQYWSRDPDLSGPDRVGLTDALQFLVVP